MYASPSSPLCRPLPPWELGGGAAVTSFVGHPHARLPAPSFHPDMDLGGEGFIRPRGELISSSIAVPIPARPALCGGFVGAVCYTWGTLSGPDMASDGLK